VARGAELICRMENTRKTYVYITKPLLAAPDDMVTRARRLGAGIR
jgi:hypothetical protein